MLKQHIKTNAACTISVMEVPFDEASRFGIMNTNPDGSIYEFEEKPKNPKSNLASMGIYVFSWDKLKKYLTEDEERADSSNDFGKDIIPAMVGAGETMMVYRFDDYWKDVGTVDSLWEANLDLLNPKIDLNLSDPNWRIYSRTSSLHPQYIDEKSSVENSLVTDGCHIYGKLDYSILFENVTVEEGASVEYSLVMPGAVIKKGAQVKYSIIAENTVVEENASVGTEPSGEDWGITLIGADLKIGKGASIGAKEMIVENVKEGEKI